MLCIRVQKNFAGKIEEDSEGEKREGVGGVAAHVVMWLERGEGRPNGLLNECCLG